MERRERGEFFGPRRGGLYTGEEGFHIDAAIIGRGGEERFTRELGSIPLLIVGPGGPLQARGDLQLFGCRKDEASRLRWRFDHRGSLRLNVTGGVKRVAIGGLVGGVGVLLAEGASCPKPTRLFPHPQRAFGNTC